MPLLQHMYLLQAWLRGRDYTFLSLFIHCHILAPRPTRCAVGGDEGADRLL